MPEVVGVWKEGGYGTTVWFHELSCGHIVTGRRRSTKPVLPCSTCDQLSSLPPEDITPDDFDERPAPSDLPVTPDETARLLESEVMLRLRLAGLLGIPVDSISVVETSGDGTPAVLVTLFPPQVRELLSRG
jgi:hypothetical protein